MAGLRGSFGGNVDFAYGQRAMLGRQMDIAGGIERGLSSVGGFTKKMGEASQSVRQLNQEIRNLQSQRGAAIMAGDAKAIARLTKEINASRKSLQGMKKDLDGMPFKALEQGLGNLTKGLLKFNTSLLGLGFDFVIDSIKRVYELQERWAKAIGGFNLQLGGMTKGLGGATKAAVQWSSTLRGLTDGDIAEGIQMFGEFALSLGQIKKALDFQKWGIEVARGFNLGGAGAAKLAATLDSMGDSSEQMTRFMGADLVKSANAAGVPINLLAKDIAESTSYMARFGKEGQKTFVQGAAFAHKFYLSIKDVQKSVEGLDMFDEAAKTASKLNSVFGTMINSMDVMMEDDPAKRIEMIRQQFLALGKTEDRLSPKEIRYLSETMKLTEDQTRALLSQKNAGVSYADFQKKAAVTEKEELDAKRNMEIMLRKTAQTMFAFGAAFDRVTVAIANAIKPMLKVFGLAHDGGKEFKSFGEVMGGITDTVVEFFNSLAKDPRWNDFMETLAKDMISAGHALKEFVLSGNAAKMVGDLASAMKDFYVWVRDLAKSAIPLLEPLGRAFLFLAKHVDRLAVAWLSIKASGGIGSMLGSMGAMQGGSMGKMFVSGGGGSKAIGGMGIGVAAGGLMGGGGAMIGGALGGMMGPLGGIVGAGVGKLIQLGIEYFFPKKASAIEIAREELTKSTKTAALAEEAHASLLGTMRAQAVKESDARQMWGKRLLELDKKAHAVKGKTVTLTQEEVESLRARANELRMFSKDTVGTSKALAAVLSTGNATAGQLDVLANAAAQSGAKLEAMNASADEYLKLQQADLAKTKLAEMKGASQYGLDASKAKLASEKSELERMGGGISSGERGKLSLTASASGKNIWDMSAKEILENEKLRKRLGADEIKRLKKQTEVDDLELSVTKAEKDNVELKARYDEEIFRIQGRSALMIRDDFKQFAADPEEAKKDTESVINDFLSKNKGSLVDQYGETGYNLLASKGIIPRAVTPSYTANRLPATVNGMPRGVSAQNRAPIIGSGNSGGTQIVHSVGDVYMDSRKVGAVHVSTAVTGRP